MHDLLLPPGTAPRGSRVGQSWAPPPPTRPGPLPSPSRSGHPLWPRRAGGRGGWHRRRRQLPAVISLCRLGFRQPLITRLLMRPAAVCNYPGPRRAAREATGESAYRGVEGGEGCVLGPARAGRSPSVTSILSQWCHRTIIIPTLQRSKGTEAQRNSCRHKQNSR